MEHYKITESIDAVSGINVVKTVDFLSDLDSTLFVESRKVLRTLIKFYF